MQFHQNADPKYHVQLVLLLMDLKSIVQNFLAMLRGIRFPAVQRNIIAKCPKCEAKIFWYSASSVTSS